MSKKPAWQILLERHDKLAQSMRADIYDRVKMLSQVFDDKDFEKHSIAEKKTRFEILNKHVSDLFTTFDELYHMLTMFPLKTQWVGGNLADMRAKMVAKMDAERKKSGGGKKKRTRHVYSNAEVDKMKEEIKTLKKENSHLRAELESCRKTIDTLNNVINKAG